MPQYLEHGTSWTENSHSGKTIADSVQFEAEGRQKQSEAGRKEGRVGCRSVESCLLLFPVKVWRVWRLVEEKRSWSEAACGMKRSRIISASGNIPISVAQHLNFAISVQKYCQSLPYVAHYKFFSKYNIPVHYKPNNLRQELVHLKDKTPKHKLSCCPVRWGLYRPLHGEKLNNHFTAARHNTGEPVLQVQTQLSTFAVEGTLRTVMSTSWFQRGVKLTIQWVTWWD